MDKFVRCLALFGHERPGLIQSFMEQQTDSTKKVKMIAFSWAKEYNK